MVCRSAIEFAVRDRMSTLGQGSILEEFEKSPNGDSLEKLIELAKKHLRWQYKFSLDEAHKVRLAANRAVHRNPPQDEECRGWFLSTRTIMHELYGES